MRTKSILTTNISTKRQLLTFQLWIQVCNAIFAPSGSSSSACAKMPKVWMKYGNKCKQSRISTVTRKFESSCSGNKGKHASQKSLSNLEMRATCHGLEPAVGWLCVCLSGNKTWFSFLRSETEIWEGCQERERVRGRIGPDGRGQSEGTGFLWGCHKGLAEKAVVKRTRTGFWWKWRAYFHEKELAPMSRHNSEEHCSGILPSCHWFKLIHPLKHKTTPVGKSPLLGEVAACPRGWQRQHPFETSLWQPWMTLVACCCGWWASFLPP